MTTTSALVELQQVLTIPPAGISGAANNNPTAVAHANLQVLRDTGDERFLFLRTILELSSSNHQHHEIQKHEELLFHCLTGCRHVVLHKWQQFSPLFRESLRDYLLNWAMQGQLPRTIEMASYTTVGSFWKRQWNDVESHMPSKPRPEEQTLVNAMRQAQPHMTRLHGEQELFQYIKSMLQPNQDMRSAAKFLSVLVGEFVGKSAVNYNLPLFFHQRAHSSFEHDGWLEQCLQLAMGALGHIVSHLGEQINGEQGNVALAVVQLTNDVLSWEFGPEAFDAARTISKTMIRPPETWRDYLIRPDFVGAVFHMHERVARSHEELSHSLRQLLLLLASLTGPIFENPEQRKAFATYLVDGSLKLLAQCASNDRTETSELLDVLSLVSRIMASFKLSVLVQLPTMVQLLSAINATGTALLQANLKECEQMHGDVESMEHREWREEALKLLLDGLVLLCGDPWLLYSGTEESRKAAQTSLAQALGPLYNAFVSCRIGMARLEEHYLTSRAAELDEVREEISALDLEEEMTSVAVLGRLDLANALGCLSEHFGRISPGLGSLWQAQGVADVSPDGAAVLEETRLLTMCIGHLLTDDNSGEAPVIPEAIVMACRGNQATANAIASAVQSVLALAEMQASQVAVNPSDPRLSPLLATAFLFFLNRFAPAYVHPVDYGTTADEAPSRILSAWSTEPASNQILSFCSTLCLHYQCYWPQERQVQEGASSLIASLGKRGNPVRSLLLASPSLTQMATFHCLTAGIRHGALPTELEGAVQAKAPAMMPSLNMIRGYHRLRYDDKSRILTALLIVASDLQNVTANAMFQECLNAVQIPFSSLVQALSSKQVSPGDVNVKEMASLCVELYGGVVRAGEIDEPERIPVFVTPSLPHLSGLMAFESFAQDLTVCEGLLRFFRDYTEQFVAMLDRSQSLALFQASAELLKSYSTQHCASRVVRRPSAAEADAEEEQNYSDVLCAVQLLIHLGTKDFLDMCTTRANKDGVESNQVTDVIFFGLQQIIPLMTQGLLQFPTLCTQYFSLVGFMMDTYPDKVCILPYDLFDALLESLLFGMSHLDPFVSKSSLQGIAGLAKEHLKTKALDQHLALHPDIFDRCSSRLLKEVVFQSIVWDRLEPCGMALLPLAAVHVQRFVAVVQALAQQVPVEHQARLQAAFEGLIQPDAISKVANGGYEGRMNRIRFKKAFEDFVKEVHSFLIIR